MLCTTVCRFRSTNTWPDSNFKIPIYRDLLMALGMGSVARRSCTNILAQGPGSAITIVVGGAAESLAAHPGTHDLTLKKRFGFIKVAIREGADLVPVFSFGENDVSFLMLLSVLEADQQIYDQLLV